MLVCTIEIVAGALIFNAMIGLGSFALSRLYLFRKEVMTLWFAFFHPATPVYLKGAMLLVVLYLVSPLDLIPDLVPLLGLIDDIVLVPLAVGWIASRLPLEVRAAAASKVGSGRTTRR